MNEAIRFAYLLGFNAANTIDSVLKERQEHPEAYLSAQDVVALDNYTARVYVVTAKPYHDNSTVMGAFLDLESAVNEIKAEMATPWIGERLGDLDFDLQAFENSQPLKKLMVYRDGCFIAKELHNKFVRAIYPHTDRCQCDFEEVDPFTFDWENYEPIELEKKWNAAKKLYE